MGKFSVYAIINGKNNFSGIVKTWDICKSYTIGVKGGVIFKGFNCNNEA
jgi:viroplasmin and RNaseH domain-containing protein